MKKQLNLILIAFCVPFLLTAQPSTNDLIISEYIEGSSYNKYLEIYNGTGQSVDLSDYEVHVFSNGIAADKDDVSGLGVHGTATFSILAETADEVILFPNPARDFISIRSDKKVEEVRIFDMTGQPARVPRHFDGRINVSALRSGIYIAKIRLTGNEFRILKFTKE
ncbi:MAG: hypothetical protein PWQ06_425 [Anaerophaga sp.]|nr:hypothetical protein [Anaerophaga sp.]